jgi:hypothetical protein
MRSGRDRILLVEQTAEQDGAANPVCDFTLFV